MLIYTAYGYFARLLDIAPYQRLLHVIGEVLFINYAPILGVKR